MICVVLCNFVQLCGVCGNYNINEYFMKFMHVYDQKMGFADAIFNETMKLVRAVLAPD